jgi:hypothetical protein
MPLQELEEFAAKFDGYQKQRSRRLAAQPTPMLDQLARETNNQFWLANAEQLSALETNLLRLVQRTDSTRARCQLLGDGDTSSGRESVTTVISTSSSETLRCGGRHSSSETLRWGGEEEAARVSAEDWPEEGRPGQARRLLHRSHSEAGALGPGAGDGDYYGEQRQPWGEAGQPLGEAGWRAEENRRAEEGWRPQGCSHCLGWHGPGEACRDMGDTVSAQQCSAHFHLIIHTKFAMTQLEC